MKNAKLFLWLPALGVLAVALTWAQPLAVAPQYPGPAAQQEQSQPYDSMTQQSDVRTFTGKVMKSGENLVLKNNANQTTYKLDNQERAKSFEGRTVKVTGTLDATSNTIHVASIELESGT